MNAIKKLCTGKAPGSDGLTTDFYKHFSVEISPILAFVFNEVMENKTLSSSQRLAIITLIFKKGDHQDTANYRPISLTNCDYKILAYILAMCLEGLLPSIIHPNQTAYMKSCFIGTNIHSVQDVISDKTNSTGSIVLFLDFCKAFDSVNHVFLFT